MKRFRWLLVVAIGWLVAPNLWAAEEPKASDEGKAVTVTGTLVIDNSDEAKPGEKAANPPLVKTGKGVLFLTGPGESSPYWIGLNVEAKDSGLVVEGVAPDSPAAKAGIKPHDVLKTVDGKPLKKGEDLVKAVQQAKETDLAIDVMRGDKKEKLTFTVRPAKRPASGGIQFQIGEGGEGKGGIQFIIEGDEGKRGEAFAPREKARKQAEEAAKKAMTAAKAAVRERVKRQHDLAEKAWQLVQRIETLGEGKPETDEACEQLERIEGELRQTLGPAPGFPARQPFFSTWTPANPSVPAPRAATGSAANYMYGFGTAAGPYGPVPPPAWGAMPVVPAPGAAAKGPPGVMTINSPSGVTVTITATPTPAATAAPVVVWSGGSTNMPAPPDAAEHRLRELKEKAEQLIKAGETKAAQRIKHEIEELQEAIKQMPPHMGQSTSGITKAGAGTLTLSGANSYTGAPGPIPFPRDPGVQELRAQVQDLRHQVEEMKGMLKTVIESQKKRP